MSANSLVVRSLILGSMGCAKRQTFDGTIPCDEHEVSVTADDDRLGFSAADFYAFISDGPRPTAIVWDEITQGAKQSTLSLSVDGYSTDAVVVLENYGCEEGDAALRVPLQVSVDIAEGGLLASGQLPLVATDLSGFDSVRLTTPWPDSMYATLSADFSEELDSFYDETMPSGRKVTGVHLEFDGEWPDGRVLIVAEFEDDDSTGANVLWSGHWQF